MGKIMKDGGNQKHSVHLGLLRWIFRETFGVFLVALLLFLTAGTLDWVWGWALVILYAIWTLFNGLIIGIRNPELLVERATRKNDGKDKDTLILSLIGILTLAKYILAGYDFRYRWSAPFSSWIHLLGFLFAFVGYSLVSWAMVENAFFSLETRLQPDRDQKVITSGPYHYVRHPGYIGTILFELFNPLLLGSWWAFIPSSLILILIVMRTIREDKMLMQNLDGYQEYAKIVNYRYFPEIW
jgi:protein-S-isoprenylcysteine O-methyltransferase Ste14